MTIEEHSVDHGFNGLMKSLNLESNVFKEIDENLERLDLNQLGATKDEIERQLSILFDILKNEYNADMDTNLLTSDNFPRNDIDVVSIRLIRVKIIRLRNDHSKVLALLSEKLQTAFTNREGTQTGESTRRQDSRYVVPFAVVKEVKSGGPAERSGLREHDRIVRLGNTHSANHNNLSRLVSEVRENEEKIISVHIIRGAQDIHLELRPTSRWNGQGLLGCHILPL